MTDWLDPTEDSLLLGVTGVIPILKARDFDSASLFLNTPSAGLLTGMMRYVRASNKLQEWDGAVWQDKLISLAGGGTGAATAADARTNLGLGTIVTQNANNVNITGGNLAGSGSGITNLNADNLASGTVPNARFPATLPAISGVNLTNLNASNLASGTVPDARFPATLPALNGSLLTALNATQLTSGTVPLARLGSGGTPSATTFLAGDNTWKSVGMRNIVPVDSTLTFNVTAEEQDINIGVSLTDFTKAWFVVQTSLFVAAGSRFSCKLVAAATLRVRAENLSASPQPIRIVGVVVESF